MEVRTYTGLGLWEKTGESWKEILGKGGLGKKTMMLERNKKRGPEGPPDHFYCHKRFRLIPAAELSHGEFETGGTDHSPAQGKILDVDG